MKPGLVTGPSVYFQSHVSELCSPPCPAWPVPPPSVLLVKKPAGPHRVSPRLVEALKLRDQQEQPVKALSEGVKRKVGAGLGLLCAARRPVPDAVPLVAAVLRAEHPGKPFGGAAGRAVHGHGPRGPAADVVRSPARSGRRGRLAGDP